MSESIFMQISRDVTEEAMVLRVIGAGEAWLENYQTLMEYTDERIRVSGKYSEIQIEGYGMRIEYYGNIDMKIQGVIRKIQFEDYS